MKKVLVVVIDALASRVIDPALREGRLPNLQRLAQAASWRGDSIAVFPSITPAATSSLITGKYPIEHNVFGAYWYKPDEKTVVYYGYDMWGILHKGIGNFIEDFVVRFNRDFLRTTSLFHDVTKAGKEGASLNYLVFAGDCSHEVHIPVLLKLLPGIPSEQSLKGPELLYFGDFVQTPLPTSQEVPSVPGGPFHSFGYTDETSVQLALSLIQDHGLADLTVLYLPENDRNSHAKGPEAAVEDLRETDALLGKIFDAYGGLEQLLQEVAIVLTGDHSQSDVLPEKEEPGIALEDILSEFSVAATGMPMESQDDLVVCPNLRTAQVYFHTPTREALQAVVDDLLVDTRVDQVMWSAGLLDVDQIGVHVVTAARGTLHFWPAQDDADEAPKRARDAYGCVWCWEGDLETVDASVEEADDGPRLVFRAYPNAFERIDRAVTAHESGHLWMTSFPGYEFQLEGSTVHAGGGSHGSLHRLDSVSPLWVAGAPDDFDFPKAPRAVDVAPICRALLGIEGLDEPDVSHVHQPVA